MSFTAILFSTVRMKSVQFQMKFSTADMQAHFKEVIDEIKIFEGINHPNLVKYYGVEVHRVSNGPLILT